MMSTKYTVVIPTRERCETLCHTLRTCIDQTYENFDIIVSDNHSQDNTRAVVSSFGDKRIRYINTGRRVSMTENFEYGLSHVGDGFVMFIGDDDGLLPQAIEKVDAIVKRYNVKAVTSAICLYVWPSHPDTVRRNSMSWPAKSSVEIRNSAEWLHKFLTFEPYYTFDLPGLYGGFVHIDALKSMFKDGKFFHSITPDAYSSLACALATDKFAFSYRPFAISGASGRSNGASYLLGVDKSESEKFFEENTIAFHPKLKMCPSFRIIAAEAFLQIKDAFPELTGAYALDMSRLLGAAMTEGNENTAPLIIDAVKQMANMNDIPFDSLEASAHKRHPLRRMQNFVRKATQFLVLATKYVSIRDTSRFSAFNVYDAAKVANVFMEMNAGTKATRTVDSKINHWTGRLNT